MIRKMPLPRSNAEPLLPLTRRGFAACGLAALLPAASWAASPVDIVAALNGFGHDLFLRRLTDPVRNTLLSPISLGFCTAMAASGSAGMTAAEFEMAFRLAPGSCGQVADLSRPLSQALRNVAGLSIANALAFPYAATGIRADYISLMRNSFDGEILTSATVPGVNAWVSGKTHGRIPQIIADLGDLTLINALHFKGEWPHPGETASNGAFVTARGENILVPRMKKTAQRCLELAGAQTFCLPYKNSTVAMIIVLPSPTRRAADVAHDIAFDSIKRILVSFESSQRFDYLHMPTFKIDVEADMADAFKDIGLRSMFDAEKADFGGIKDRPTPNLYVDRVIHKAVINVDQLGTESAAVAAMGFRFSGGTRFADERDIQIDRPFLFYLVDRSTGATLMQGCINDPRPAIA